MFKEKEMARAQPFEVVLYPYVGVEGIDEIWNDLTYEHYKLNEPSRDLPIGVFEAL